MRFSLLLLVIPAVLWAQPIRAQSDTTATAVMQAYIGLRYPLGNLTLEPRPDGVQYTVTEVEHRGRRQLWLERHHAYDSEYFAHNVVRAVLPVPELPWGQRLIYAVCTRDGTYKDGIIAVVQDTGEEKLTGVLQAWRVNQEAESFDPVPPKGITCYQGQVE